MDESGVLSLDRVSTALPSGLPVMFRSSAFLSCIDGPFLKLILCSPL